MSRALEQSCFRILAFMKRSEFPLTEFEVWKWCDCADVSLVEVQEVLRESGWLKKLGVRSSEGFWGIGDVSSWREERIARIGTALRKHRRAKHFARYAAWLPWVRMIAICNTLAHSFTREESDIDLFIVTKPKRMWSTRLFVTGALALLRLRPEEASRDPLCLSFFVDSEHVDLAPLKISAEDPYLALWTASLSPVLDRDDDIKKLHAVNRWIRPMFPRLHAVARPAAHKISGLVTLPDVGIFEAFAARIQRARFPVAIRRAMNQGTGVVVTEGVLKFHEHDMREEILLSWKTECERAGI